MKCEFCKNEHDGSYGSGRFCKEHCSRMFSKSKLDQKAKKVIQCSMCHKDLETNIHSDPKTTRCSECKKIKSIRIRTCKWCNQTPCLRKDICKHFKLFTTLISKFGMNPIVIGTINIYEEYERIQTLIQEEYIDNKLSLTELAKKYNYRKQKIRQLSEVLDALNIQKRDIGESLSLAYLNGRKCCHPQNGNYQYKHGWYTTWNNKQVYFRSSYEEDYYKNLDSQKIDYEVETLKIQYWDSEQLRLRTAIPDIYIPSTNTIIEIKSQYTFDIDKQRMIDKFKTYKRHGYNTKLILEKKEISIEEILVGDAGLEPATFRM